MAAINDLISQIQDETLRNRIQEEVSKMAKQKKFGLVFEEHMPESTPLYDMPIKRGCNVMLRDSKDDKSIYVVLKVEGDTAVCVKPEQKDEAVTFELKDIVRVAEFGESIYPYLKPLDSVCNAPDSDLWHTLIEADNYHALQLLEYLYAGKVDCIYIDPPYNTGAKDWKYNNDYVDGNDAYRHSKWLSFMQRRLQLAKKLLNPADSVLIVTIDEKEYLHLGCLLEEMFPEARMQMITTVISAKGVVRTGQLSRVEEYIFILEWGGSCVCSSIYNMLNDEVKKESDRSIEWLGFRRRAPQAKRNSRPNQFYPIYVNNVDGKIASIGDVVQHGIDRNSIFVPDGCTALWPLSKDGDERLWSLVPEQARLNFEKGYLKVNNWNSANKSGTVYYLPSGTIKDIENGKATIVGYNTDGSVEAKYHSEGTTPPKRVWNMKTHNAETYGTNILNAIIGKRFDYPKSLYAVHDVIRFFVANKPNAIIVDFFSGSGTTLHAVNLLNAEDGGHRRCIMVTNNEVSADEAKMLKDKGYQPGDAEWEKLGIAHYVTWPRTVCSIEGHDVNGNPLKGNYIGSDIPMADGFKANAAFFKLGFLDPTAVSLGMRFSEMLPTLWLKTGAKGKCPELTGKQVPDMLILPENQFAVLINENTFADFAEKLAEHPEIQTVFLATDYEVNYQSMVKNLNVENAYQLYRDYLDHFRVNRGRN
ncbi:DNA methyltransferase [Faecalibacterium sp. OM04-11BH]|uniref:site-specific DNA-methyltransferase n=1 Tax=Faecalibacterium sp. OM04-11BH TaxID=2292357 RepID=UPI000E504DAC|nr:DNA methyltransferase [Faecalibacterium sp. OM04-11BH]RHV55466.1 site-specific DNA-methyltransferase [Faecalibacterium sp. OM04-11BH]